MNEKLDEIRQKMEGAYELLVSDKEPAGHCGCILKGWNSHCTTSEYSNPDLPEYPVHAIARINKKKLIELVDNNILSIHDVPSDFELSDNQRRQVDTAQSDKEYIDSTSISEFLETMKYQNHIDESNWHPFTLRLPSQFQPCPEAGVCPNNGPVPCGCNCHVPAPEFSAEVENEINRIVELTSCSQRCGSVPVNWSRDGLLRSLLRLALKGEK